MGLSTKITFTLKKHATTSYMKSVMSTKLAKAQLTSSTNTEKTI